MRGYGGRHDRVYEYTFFEQVACNCKCLEVVADEQGDNRCGCRTYLASHIAKSVESVVCNLPEVFLAFRLCFHYFNSLECGSGRSRCYRGGEYV